jgi:hypothetical protein
VDQLHADAQARIEPLQEIHLLINDVPIIAAAGENLPDITRSFTNVSVYRASSPAFSFFLPQNNIRQLSGCNTIGTVSPAVTEGWAAMLPPLPTDGNFDIRFGAKYGSPSDYTFDVLNHVHVAK